MPLTTVRRSGSSCDSLGSRDSLFFDDDIDHARPSTLFETEVAVPSQQTETPTTKNVNGSAAAESRLQQAKYTIASLRSMIEQLQDSLDEATSNAVEVENENAKLRQQVSDMTREREETMKMVGKVKKIAEFLKEDVRQSDAECVELRLEVEALKRERDEYKERAGGGSGNCVATNDTTTAGTAAADHIADLKSVADRNTASSSMVEAPSTDGDDDKVRTMQPNARRLSAGSLRTSRTADTSRASRHSHGQNPSLVAEDYDAEDRSIGDGGESNCIDRTPAFAPLDAVAVRRRRKVKKSGSGSGSGKAEKKASPADTAAKAPHTMVDVPLIQ